MVFYLLLNSALPYFHAAFVKNMVVASAAWCNFWRHAVFFKKLARLYCACRQPRAILNMLEEVCYECDLRKQALILRRFSDMGHTLCFCNVLVTSKVRQSRGAEVSKQ